MVTLHEKKGRKMLKERERIRMRMRVKDSKLCSVVGLLNEEGE